MGSVYANYSREDLIREIEMLKAEDSSVNVEKTYKNRMLTNAIALRKTFSDVLALLMRPGQKHLIDQSLLVILKFFDVDRVYIGNFEENKPTFNFTHEVTCQGIISMREDILTEMPQEDFPWWIKTIREGTDIIINDIDYMPAEAVAEQNILRVQNIVSLLAIPIFHEGATNSFIGLDCVRQKRTWTPWI